jgi:glycosyltransferase involved in cell wall biosynthesis
VRVLIFSPHFGEYSLRYASSLADFATVELIASVENLRNETQGMAIRTNPNLVLETLPLDTNRSQYFGIPSVVSAIVRFRPDIIHMQEVAHPIFAILVQIFRWRYKIVLTVHDPVLHSGIDSQISTFRIWCRDWARRAADLIVVHGRYCRESFEAQHKGKAGRIVESQHGEILVPAPEQRTAPIAGRLLFFGRMQPYKGLETLTAAAELLHARGVKFSLHVAGSGPDLDRLERRLRALPETIVENRYMPPRDIVNAMQQAELVVMPYRDATQSGVVSVAFGNGRPVVASRVGGLPDVVEDGRDGILVPPNDPGALAAVLEELIPSRDRLAALATGAGRTAQEKLNWNKIASEMMSEYALCLQGGGRAADDASALQKGSLAAVGRSAETTSNER